MVRLFAASGASRIVLLEIAEQSLFQIDAEMAGRGCIPVLGSVCDASLLDALLREYRPELLLHAAALKHAPLMERNPLAALETNALGTWRLCQAAEAHGVRNMILVSTDKAVAPHSIMGAAKRMAELAMLNAGSSRKAAVRLANVIGSPCSVGPIFADQLTRGVPLTVTHREARRYFLTLREVVTVLADAIDSDAEGILVPDPGESLSIAELARRMIAATGHSASIAFTEPRPGDKLDESLLSTSEHLDGSITPMLRHISSSPVADLDRQMRNLEQAVTARDLASALAITQALVSDYHPSAVVRAALAQPREAKP